MRYPVVPPAKLVARGLPNNVGSHLAHQIRCTRGSCVGLVTGYEITTLYHITPCIAHERKF